MGSREILPKKNGRNTQNLPQNPKFGFLGCAGGILIWRGFLGLRPLSRVKKGGSGMKKHAMFHGKS
jgi:hypothetical protein